MQPYVDTQGLFNGNIVVLHDLEMDIYIMKGHHCEEDINTLLQDGAGVPLLFRTLRVVAGTVTRTWTLFSWHRPNCDAVGEDAPWCLCGLDESGSRVDWYPTPADPGTPHAVPVAWFRGTR